jgi:hypothetical protein
MDRITKPARVFVGVDPAFRKGGFWACFLDMTERSATFRVFRDVLEFDRFLQSPDAPENAVVCVENSNLQNKNFDMTGSRPELARKGRNVGTNQAASQLAVQSAIDRYGVKSVLNISPRAKGAKLMPAQFVSILAQDRINPIKYTGNQDQRDAYKLAAIALQQSRIR